MADKLESLVGEYVKTGLELRNVSRKRPFYTRITGRYNPDIYWLAESFFGQKQVVRDMYGLIGNNSGQSVINYSRRHHATKDAGMLIGCLLPNEPTPEKNSDFNLGLLDGQVLGLKLRNGQYVRTYAKGLALAFLGFYLNRALAGNSKIDPDYIQTFNAGLEIGKIGAVSGFLYGNYAMIRNNLFGNDSNLSPRLVTEGQFALHRNPFYAGMISALLSIDADICLETFSQQSPNWIPFAIMAAGTCLFLKGLYRYTLQDERALEKQFGDEYRDYKARTPRYFPNPLNLFRRNK
jgi:protein-S-isoprenylcysteine O-methyltransferase Ste14